MLHKKSIKKSEWLVFFYSIPAQPVSNRVRIWRKLAKVGFISFKGAVYLIPHSSDNYELCQWLVIEVVDAGGEAAFFKTNSVEGMQHQEIIRLFHDQRQNDYQSLLKRLELVETKADAIRSGSFSKVNKRLDVEYRRLLKDYEEIRKIDFFESSMGKSFKRKLDSLEKKLRDGHALRNIGTSTKIVLRDPADFQNKIWVTREKPFVDRMASAWLIGRFIDKNPSFRFVRSGSVGILDPKHVGYDIDGGMFSHIGDLCTFEVLLKSFGLKQKMLRKLAEVVHELDLRDGKYRSNDADGFYEILLGVRKSGLNDREAMEKGIMVFDLIYQAKV